MAVKYFEDHILRVKKRGREPADLPPAAVMNLMTQERGDIFRLNAILDRLKFGITGDQPGKKVMILELFGKKKEMKASQNADSDFHR
jgi:hypothetical protein